MAVRTTLLAIVLGALTLLGAPGTAPAQGGPRIAPSGAVPLARARAAKADLRVPPVDVYELSRYAGWGGAIGGALGVGYALAFERGEARHLLIIWDGLIGFTGGLVAGTAVYIVRAVREDR